MFSSRFTHLVKVEGLGVWGLGFKDEGSGFSVQGLGVRG